MQRVYFILALLPAFVFISCESNEDKANKLIKQEMFKTLYDYSSYEPIETTIDSSFTSLYRDTLNMIYAYQLKKDLEEGNKYLDKAKDASRSMDIWRDSYSSLGRSKYSQAIEEYLENIEKVNTLMAKIKENQKKIKQNSENFKPEFCGWEVKHKYRCKNRGGNFALGNNLYIFDNKFKNILYFEDLDDEDLKEIVGIIGASLEYEEEE